MIECRVPYPEGRGGELYPLPGLFAAVKDHERPLSPKGRGVSANDDQNPKGAIAGRNGHTPGGSQAGVEDIRRIDGHHRNGEGTCGIPWITAGCDIEHQTAGQFLEGRRILQWNVANPRPVTNP